MSPASKLSQAIQPFPSIGSKTYGVASFAVDAPLANSGLEVALSVKSGPAIVDGRNITVTGVGEVTLAANQSGDTFYAPAEEVTATFLVLPPPDLDFDGLANDVESNTGVFVDATDTGTDPDVADTDHDGLNDGDEVNTYGTDPLTTDSDGDGLSDGAEVNAYSTNPKDVDTDNDGLRDNAEIETYATDPKKLDTDDDGTSDYRESMDGTNPNDAISFNALSKGLVAYYPFNGNANDESGFFMNGSVAGASYDFNCSGQSEHALHLGGGGQQVTLPYSEQSYDLGSRDFSYCFWILHDGPEAFERIGGGNTLDGRRFWFETVNGYLRVYSFDNSLNQINWETPRQIGVGKWSSIVLNRKSGTLQLFVDGIKTDEVAYDHTIRTSTDDFTLGINLGCSEFFRGKLDNFRVYNRALSEGEIAQLYRTERWPIPAIELNSANPLQIFKGDTFTDPGATVADDVDEARTINGSGTVDTTTIGTYTLTYEATDTDGNNAQSVTRTVNVVLNPAGDEDGDGVTNYRELADGTDFNDPASFSQLSKGLVAYYPFDGNANDESGFNNHGAVIGAAPTNNMFDEENRAYAFQNAMVDFGNSQTLELTNDFCINTWCKLRSNDPLWTPRSPWSPFIVKRNDFASMNWQFYYTREPSTVNFQVGPNGQYTIFQKTIEPLLEWNMLSVTRKGDLWQLFLNGQLIDNTTSSAEIQTGDSIRVAAFDADELDFYGSQDNVRLYNRALNTNEIAQLYYAEGFTLRQKQFVESHPSTAGLYSKDEYSISRTNGQTDVTTNPSAFNLFTQQEFNSNRTAGQSDVINNPMSYGLYTSNSIMDLRMNGLMLQKNGSNAVVSFQPQTTTDLTQPFTNNGTPITHEIPMPGNKGFIRIQANPGPPPTPVPTPPPYNFGL